MIRKQLEGVRLNVQHSFFLYLISRLNGPDLLPAELERIQKQALEMSQVNFKLPVRAH